MAAGVFPSLPPLLSEQSIRVTQAYRYGCSPFLLSGGNHRVFSHENSRQQRPDTWNRKQALQILFFSGTLRGHGEACVHNQALSGLVIITVLHLPYLNGDDGAGPRQPMQHTKTTASCSTANQQEDRTSRDGSKSSSCSRADRRHRYTCPSPSIQNLPFIHDLPVRVSHPPHKRRPRPSPVQQLNHISNKLLPHVPF